MRKGGKGEREGLSHQPKSTKICPEMKSHFIDRRLSKIPDFPWVGQFAVTGIC